MKIAIITFRFPYPPNRGDRLTLLNFLRLLKGRHEVELFALCEREPSAEGRRAVARHGVVSHVFRVSKRRSLVQAALALPGRHALQTSYFRSEEMMGFLRAERASTDYDVVMAHTVRMVPEARLLRAKRRIFWAVDSLSMSLRRSLPATGGPGRLLLAEEARRLARDEMDGSRWSDEVWMVSPVDAHDIPTDRREKVRLVRQGIGWEPPPGAEWEPDGRTLLFVGRMDVRHNVEAARRLCIEVLPRVRRRLPGVRVRLVGASPAPGVRRLAAIEGVEVLGAVESLTEEYSRALALVAPLTFCAGVQNKILEACALGVPVVTTPGPASGVGDPLHGSLWIGESDDELAEAVLAVARDPESARTRALQARVLVRREFRWERMLEALESPL